MLTIRNTRGLRRRCHQAFVWAMVPLAVLNGHTVLSCGCSGRVLAECHCGRSLLGENTQRHGSANCPKCAASKLASPASCCSKQGMAEMHNGAPSFGGHHCRGVADYQVLPATTVLSLVDEHVANLGAIAASPTALDEMLSTSRELPFSIAPHPPNDLVVVLHRLVI